MNASDTTLQPLRLGEIVLATGRYDAMKAWYAHLFGSEPSLEHAVDIAAPPGSPTKPTRMCFFRLHTEHPYQDVVAIFEMPGTGGSRSSGPGLHHMQLRNACMPDLRERYRRLRERGVEPYRSMDHGPSTSLYYRDPDCNAVEIAASNFSTQECFEAYLASDVYRQNPSGKAIDPLSLLGP